MISWLKRSNLLSLRSWRLCQSEVQAPETNQQALSAWIMHLKQASVELANLGVKHDYESSKLIRLCFIYYNMSMGKDVETSK